MLSTLHRKTLQSALTAPKSAARLRASAFVRTVSQHGRDRELYLTKMMSNINVMEIAND